MSHILLVTHLESTTRLLIEGRPGSGKTTLVHKFSQDWARGNPQLNLRNINLLFLVHLRGFFNNQNVKLRDIVQLYYTEDSLVDTIVQQAEKSSGEGFCFILDGLDEYRPKPMKNTFIFKLIERAVLPMSVVIIASRPAASSQFRRKASKQVEVIGFMKEQIYDYIEKYPFPNIEKRSELHKYLEHHSKVHHMCYLPIHAAMVCYLFNIMGSTLPRTETEMYKEFTNLTLLRTLKRNQGEVQLDFFESVEDLPDVEKTMFAKICELSFQKTVSSKQVMKRSEVYHFFDQVSSGRESLGLITVDCIAKKYGFEDLYTFLHLTFQEYLAAYHLFQMDKESQLKELRKYGRKNHMQVVWKFFCGLVDFSENDTRLVELMKTAGIKKDCLFGVQCAFESQQSGVCDYVVESGEHGTLSFNGHFLTPSDLTAIGYVIKTATCPVEKLVLDRCKLGHEGVDAFLGEVGDKILSVKTLCFHNKACVCEQYELLGVCLDKMSSIETLDLVGCDLGSRKVQSLTNDGACTLPNLSTLQVSKQRLGVSLLNSRASKQCLGVSFFNSRGDFKLLLFNSSKMERVVFDDVSDLDDCSGFLYPLFGFSPLFLGSVCSMQSKLDFKGNHLTLEHIRVIAGYLKQNEYTSLNCANCEICDDGSAALADGLAHCRSLRELLLNNNKISDNGAVYKA